MLKKVLSFGLTVLPLLLAADGGSQPPVPQYSLRKVVVKGRAPECRLYLHDRLTGRTRFLGVYGDFDIVSDWVEVRGRFLVAGLGDRLSNKKLFLYDLGAGKVVLGQSLNPTNFFDIAVGQFAFFKEGVLCQVTTSRGTEWLTWNEKNQLKWAPIPSALRAAKVSRSRLGQLQFTTSSSRITILSLPKYEGESWTYRSSDSRK